MKNTLLEALRNSAEERSAPNGEKYLSISVHSVTRIAAENNLKIKELEIRALKDGIIPERYQRNIGTMGIDGQLKLLQSKVGIVGAGGIGGTVFEILVRIGVGKIILIDGDSFEDSNLNRQILSSCLNISEPKVNSAKQRAAIVNPAAEIKLFPTNANEENLPRMIEGCNAIVEAIDDIQIRFSLEKVCKKMRIPFVHGAIAGFLGQITTVFPEDKGLKFLYRYSKSSRSGIEKRLGTPCVTPMWIGSLQALEAIKIVLGWENTLRNRILFFDLENQVINISEFH